jgi:hypothetical protein
MTMRSITTILSLLALLLSCGCGDTKRPAYGVEQALYLPGNARQTWAVAPVLNLSGHREVDPVLQADLVFAQLQQVAGLNVLPVNRVVEVYRALKVDQVQSEEQAAAVCQLLGCDALLVGTVSLYDPYDPPRMGASLQLFRSGKSVQGQNVDPRELARRATLPSSAAMVPAAATFLQTIGMFDASNGSTRDDLLRYATGRNDPVGPLKDRAYLVEMDRYAGFVYHSLIEEMLTKPALQPPVRQQQGG